MFSTVRRVLPYEYIKYRKHLKSLDMESRTLRFAHPVNDEVIDQLCDRWEADHEHNILFCIEDADLNFVGIGHIAIADEMELAFSVLKAYQGQGMGNALMKRCIQWCRTHGILKGSMVCLSTNTVIRHLCAKYSIHMTNHRGELSATIELDNSNISTYITELADNNVGTLDYLGKRFARPLALLK